MKFFFSFSSQTPNGDIDYIKIVRNEAMILFSLYHPNIIGMHGYFERRGNLNTLLEIMPFNNLSLRHFINENVTAPELHYLVRQMFEGLKYLHTRRPALIHCNIEPDTILYNPITWQVKFSNFYFAKYLSNVQTVNTRPMTKYSAPEVLNGFFTVKSDIYSLGMSILSFATRREPFTGFTSMQINSITGEFIRPVEINMIEDALLRSLVEMTTNMNPLWRPNCTDIIRDGVFCADELFVSFF